MSTGKLSRGEQLSRWNSIGTEKCRELVCPIISNTIFVLLREQTVEMYLPSLANLLVNVFTAKTPVLSTQTLMIPFNWVEL